MQWSAVNPRGTAHKLFPRKWERHDGVAQWGSTAAAEVGGSIPSFITKTAYMPQYRKNLVVIEARQLTFGTMDQIKSWCGGKDWSRAPMRELTGITIPTLKGVVEASIGDFIIKGVNGEFYACNPNIFEKTYELV